MAAGLGFKTFNTGDVLSAADVNGYLMQGVLVFANATARDAAITSPQEGQFAYLKDTNVTTYYTGSAWTNLDTTGMTNPMTTTGDTIYSSSGSTPARLGIGSTGQVLTVAGGVPSWATPASGGGMTLINTGGTTLSGSSTVISSIPSGYVSLQVIVILSDPSDDAAGMRLRLNSDGTANRYARVESNFVGSAVSFNQNQMTITAGQDNGTPTGIVIIDLPFYDNTSIWKYATITGVVNDYTDQTKAYFQMNANAWNQTTAVSSLEFLPNTGTYSGGTVYVYGVK